MNIYKFIGAFGLLLIAVGIIIKHRKQQDILYVVGGICLEIYSLHLRDVIFIILQIIFTVAALYDLTKLSKKSERALT